MATIYGSSDPSGAGDIIVQPYEPKRVCGNGTFGVVFQATDTECGEVCAIKKVLQDRRFKNRELQIMNDLRACQPRNIVGLKHHYYSTGDKAGDVYLNLVLEYVPETLHRIAKNAIKINRVPVPSLLVKLYTYQLCRGLSSLHAIDVCHRDIKPQNLLVDSATGTLKICDFGSAKRLVKGETNVSYICSRYYRAPELIFGASVYSQSIDVWSAGCVLAELLLGSPLFQGENGVDQLVEIIKVLGTPSEEHLTDMKQERKDFRFPQIRPRPWHKIFQASTPRDALDAVQAMLMYSPQKRLTPLQVCASPFMDELRQPGATLPDGVTPLPPLFDFTQEEYDRDPKLVASMVPAHARDQKLYLD